LGKSQFNLRLDGDISLVRSFLGLALSFENIAWPLVTERGNFISFDRAEFGFGYFAFY